MNLRMTRRALQAVVYGDLLIKLHLATRPYEVHKGSSQKLYDKWLKTCCDAVINGSQKEFKNNIRKMIKEYEQVEVKLTNRPKVGIVGEILVKYHSFANDHLIEKLEAEGAEVFQPDLMGFVKYCTINSIIKSKLLKSGMFTALVYDAALKWFNSFETEVNKQLKNTRYRKPSNIYHLEKNVDGILSTGNQTGEGWFLTAEMVELIKEGIDNIVCVQPFACLPNHIVGKAVIKKIRSLYPDANIVAIDYDPGASHTNQVNRIKLMFTVAKENLNKKDE